MASIIQNKQEEERKAVLAEEKRKREKRHMKELGVANGSVGVTEEEDAQSEKNHLPIRSQSRKGGRSRPPMSAAVQKTNHATDFGGQPSTRDSFLNYFFSNGSSGAGTSTGTPVSNRSAHSAEPTISQSLRRSEIRSPSMQAEEYPALIDYGADRSSFPHENAEPTLTDREVLERELTRRLVPSYFYIVRETIADQVPKAIMHLLVNHSKDVVQNRLVRELYKEDLFGELLYEDDVIKAEREKYERLLKTYKEAAKIVSEVL